MCKDPAGDGIGATLVAEYRSLLQYARRLTHNGAEATDLVQTAMMYALLKGDQVPEPERIRAWLRTVVFRLFIDERRRTLRETPVGVALLEHPEVCAELRPPWTTITIDDVRRSIAQLPPHFREPYELFTFCHLSYGAIASLSALSAKTIGTRINRARKRLRVLLLAAAQPPEGEVALPSGGSL
jgi:RNA polymerase sigma-70 factor, ECF subfamily